MAEDNERPARSKDCSELLYTLMQACWVSDMSERPTITQVAKALELARPFANGDAKDAKDEIAAIEDEAAQAVADKATEVEQPEAQQITYDGFLARCKRKDKVTANKKRLPRFDSS